MRPCRMRKKRMASNGQVETKKRDGEECFDEAPLDGEETEDEGHDEDARHSEFIDKSRYDTLTWSFSAAKRQLRVA